MPLAVETEFLIDLRGEPPAFRRRRVAENGDGLADKRAARIAEHRIARRIAEERDAVGIRHIDAFHHAFQHQTLHVQRFVHPLACGHVANVALNQPPLFREIGTADKFRFDLAAVLFLQGQAFVADAVFHLQFGKDGLAGFAALAGADFPKLLADKFLERIAEQH